MRILLLADPYIAVPPKFYGGIERVVADLADEYVRRGHQVDLWAAPGSGTAADRWSFGRESEWTRWSKGDKHGEKYHELRIRTATEWDALLREAQLFPMDWWGDWEFAPFIHSSENLVVICQAR